MCPLSLEFLDRAFLGQSLLTESAQTGPTALPGGSLAIFEPIIVPFPLPCIYESLISSRGLALSFIIFSCSGVFYKSRTLSASLAIELFELRSLGHTWCLINVC